MAENEVKTWSDGLRDATQNALENVRIAPDGRLHMKNIHGGHGWFGALDLVAENYRLHLQGSDEQIVFADVSSILAAGWAID